MSFFKKLEKNCREKETLLCVGLDPPLERLNNDRINFISDSIASKNKSVIEKTLSFAACYKLNIAFYEAYGPKGLEALTETLKVIPKDMPTIIDAKRNDIGNTAEAYAESLFNFYCADCITINPYLGRESVLPYLGYRDKALFALCRTTNPGSDRIQKIPVKTSNLNNSYDSPLYLEIAREVLTWGEQIGLVVGATDYTSISRIRKEFPGIWMLTPGIGAQGGSLEKAIQLGMRDDGLGILPAVSRSIYTDSRPGMKAKEFRDRINSLLQSRKKIFQGIDIKKSTREELLNDIIQEGCLQFGSFKLKSGKTSSYYLDLRLLISNPALLSRTADAYIGMLKELDFQRIAAVPISAIPVASLVSLKLGKPLIYPRLTVKDHGTGKKIEGNYIPGEKVVLIDDVISTGKSKMESIRVLKTAGLKVSDMAVLVNRGEKLNSELVKSGIKLHSYADINELIGTAKQVNNTPKSKQ
ncbi:MAG: orotate phosphoribosyltransferase [Spirochaetes bacterium]|nr:MAG: orotate phosphoribosyltransferase [Spirochaetota bacterium]